MVLRDGVMGGEGWLQREDKGRENTLCPYFRAPLGIHSSSSFLFRCCCCSVYLSSFSLSLLIYGILIFPHCLCVYVCASRINVFIFCLYPLFLI